MEAANIAKKLWEVSKIAGETLRNNGELRRNTRKKWRALNVALPVTDGVGYGVDLLYIGGSILFDPFCQLFVLDRVGPRSKGIVEEPEGSIGFQEIRSHIKGILEALFVFVKTSAPVFYLVIFSGLQ